jgi:hypothetical protein
MNHDKSLKSTWPAMLQARRPSSFFWSAMAECYCCTTPRSIHLNLQTACIVCSPSPTWCLWFFQQGTGGPDPRGESLLQFSRWSTHNSSINNGSWEPTISVILAPTRTSSFPTWDQPDGLWLSCVCRSCPIPKGIEAKLPSTLGLLRTLIYKRSHLR